MGEELQKGNFLMKCTIFQILRFIALEGAIALRRDRFMPILVGEIGSNLSSRFRLLKELRDYWYSYGKRIAF
jgi:hypothetical protein